MRNDAYLTWLKNMVNAEDRNGLSFNYVCNILFNIRYYNTCSKDIKLLKYSNDLEEQFIEEHDFNRDSYQIRSFTSVLEVLIRLAQHAADITSGSSNEISVTDFFYEMLNNLGIAYDDKEWRNFSLDYPALILRKVKRWIDRSIGRNGSGSPFPLTSVKRWKNQRNEETWYQMQHYLEENYPI